MTEMAEEKRAALLEDRYQRYAIKFDLDQPMNGNEDRTEPTDENIAHVLRNCGRCPTPEEYPAIRRYLKLYRLGKDAGRRGLRDDLYDRAESYARDSRAFADATKNRKPITGTGGDQYWASMYRTIADELRKVAASL